MHTFEAERAAFERQGVALYLRAFAQGLVVDDPDIVSLALRVTFESPGVSVIEVEFLNRTGQAVGEMEL